MADRIRQYEFVEGRDFMTFSEPSEKGRPSKEYALTLDMAKELAMVERNARLALSAQRQVQLEVADERKNAGGADSARLELAADGRSIPVQAGFSDGLAHCGREGVVCGHHDVDGGLGRGFDALAKIAGVAAFGYVMSSAASASAWWSRGAGAARL